MAGKVKSLDGFIRKHDLDAALARERAAREVFVKEALEKAIGDFYAFLLENGHLKPTEQLDAEVRVRIDSGEIKPERPRIVYGEAG